MKKRIAIVIAGVLAAFCVIPSTSLAIDTNKDPNGDGYLNLSDAVFINQYLAGSIEPTDLSELDVNNNGIISYVDFLEVLYYDAYNSTGGEMV